MSDLLAMWWKIPAEVQRYAGSTADGDRHDDPVTILGRRRGANRMVRDAEGNEVVSSRQWSFPVTTPTIPVDSLVDGRRVIAEERHESGTGLTPDYYSVDCD